MSNDMQDFQDRGESYRQELGIDGTAGDAQDVPHLYKEDGDNDWCIACGLSLLASVHRVNKPLLGGGNNGK
jgi:hypothetical protein